MNPSVEQYYIETISYLYRDFYRSVEKQSIYHDLVESQVTFGNLWKTQFYIIEVLTISSDKPVASRWSLYKIPFRFVKRNKEKSMSTLNFRLLIIIISFGVFSLRTSFWSIFLIPFDIFQFLLILHCDEGSIFFDYFCQLRKNVVQSCVCN